MDSKPKIVIVGRGSSKSLLAASVGWDGWCKLGKYWVWMDEAKALETALQFAELEDKRILDKLSEEFNGARAPSKTESISIGYKQFDGRTIEDIVTDRVNKKYLRRRKELEEPKIKYTASGRRKKR